MIEKFLASPVHNHQELLANSKNLAWKTSVHRKPLILLGGTAGWQIVGGLPEVVAEYARYQSNPHQAFKLARSIQEKLIIQYLTDVAKHSGKVNSMHIVRVWTNAASQLANTYDGKSEKFKFKGVVPNIHTP